MFIQRAAQYDNVVHVGEPRIVEHPAEDDCHKAHQNCEFRRESERYNLVLKKSERRAKRSLLSVIRMHIDLMVAHC